MSTLALLALEDGSLFWGRSIGSAGQSVGEVVFNTAMTGYQEILTDPSYARQMVTLTCPHIGNTGVNHEDEESSKIQCAGLIIRDLPRRPSSFRSEQSLDEYLKSQGVVAIAEIDTRRLTRILREKGAQNGCLVAGEHIDENAALEAARAFPGLKGMDLAKEVTTDTSYEWTQGSWSLEGDCRRPTRRTCLTMWWLLIMVLNVTSCACWLTVAVVLPWCLHRPRPMRCWRFIRMACSCLTVRVIRSPVAMRSAQLNRSSRPVYQCLVFVWDTSCCRSPVVRRQ